MPTTSWYPSADTYLSVSPNTVTNNGTVASISVSPYSPGGEKMAESPETNGLLRFNISGTGAVGVSSATLRLTAGAAIGFSINRATGNNTWGETTISGSVRESVVKSTSLVTGCSLAAGAEGNYALPTATILAMMASGGDYTGFWLADPTTSFGYVYSKEEATVAYRPMLTITYSTNTVPTTPTGLTPASTTVNVGDPLTVSWTHNDPQSNPQSQYQIRWRRAD